MQGLSRAEESRHAPNRPYDRSTGATPSSTTTETKAEQPLHQAQTLPPVASLPGYSAGPPHSRPLQEPGSPTVSRTFGVQSILNPAAEFRPSKPPPRVSQSPGRSTSAAYGSYQAPLLSPRVRKRRDASPGRVSQPPSDVTLNRRVLTPRSPALRSLSQGVRDSPSGGALLTHPLGSMEGRVYTAEPGQSSGSFIPPLPQLNLGPYTPFSNAQAHEHMTVTASVSVTNSTTSYSANNQGYIGSPGGSSNFAERENTSPFQPSISDSGPQPPATRPYGPGQPSYQMRLPGEQGMEIIPVEVDIQQASKMADEKRKRNAGASARFRQRRKEKEAASMTTITDLQKTIRDLTEDRDFYLGERNVFRDIVARTPGAAMPARPASPQIRRAQASAQYMGGTTEQSRNMDYGRQDTMSEPSPAQRRRTSDYQPAFGPPPIASVNYPAQYTTTHGPPVYGLPPPSLPAPIQDSRPQLPGVGLAGTLPQISHPPPPPPPSAVRPPTYDPFRRDPNIR